MDEEVTDIDLLLEELERTTRWIQKLQEGLAGITDHLIETKQYIAEIHLKQKEMSSRLVDIERTISGGFQSTEKALKETNELVNKTHQQILTSEKSLKGHIETVEEHVFSEIAEIRTHIDSTVKFLSTRIDEVEDSLKRLQESLDITKSIVTYLRADIKAMSHEIKKILDDMDSKNEVRKEELIHQINELQTRIETTLEKQEKLMDVQTEKLILLQAEISSLRESYLKSFGDVSTKLGMLLYEGFKEG